MKKEYQQYQHLHQFLDKQLEGVVAREKQMPIFDQIQDKLAKIQEKLRNIKNGGKKQEKYHYGQQTSEVKWRQDKGIGSNVISKSGIERKDQPTSSVPMGVDPQFTIQSQLLQSSPSKTVQNSVKKASKRSQKAKKESETKEMMSNAKTQEEQKRNFIITNEHSNALYNNGMSGDSQLIQVNHEKLKENVAWTPAKKLQIVNRTVSATHLKGSSEKPTIKKVRKNNTTSKKKNRRTRSYELLYQSRRQKPFLSHFNEIYSPSAIEVRVLKKELKDSEKSNVQLRRRMNELRSYESECFKLKQIFDRCQQLRKHSKLNKMYK